MAEERKESYTRLFNPILDALCRQSTEISASQYAIILFVIRSTYGWNKKKFPLSKSYIAEGTAMTERCVKKNITILVNKGYLIEYGTDRKTRSKIYGLNKRFSQWGKGPAILSEGERSGSVQSDTLSVNGQVTEGARVDTDEGERLDTQKRHIQRKSIKEKEKKCSQNLPFLDSETGKWVMPEEGSEEGENDEVEEDENGDI